MSTELMKRTLHAVNKQNGSRSVSADGGRLEEQNVLDEPIMRIQQSNVSICMPFSSYLEHNNPKRFKRKLLYVLFLEDPSHLILQFSS